ERARERCGGVTNARWLPRSTVLLSVVGKRMLLVNAESGAVTHYEHPAYISGVDCNPAGNALAFASGGDLWSASLSEGGLGDVRRLTDDGSSTLLHGVPDQMTREEIFGGSAFTWANKGERLVYASFDVSAVETVPVPSGGQRQFESMRYAHPGAEVATFSVSVLEPATGERRRILEASAEWPYFCGFSERNEEEVVLLRLRRDQSAWQLLCIDPKLGNVRPLLEQSGRPWINVMGQPRFRSADGAFLVLHEPRGVACIGIYDGEGRWSRDVGEDAGHVESIVALEPGGDGVYFLATGADARERHVYFASSATGWASQRRTSEPGIHGTALLGKDGKTWSRVHESVHEPSRFSLHDESGNELFRYTTGRPRGMEAEFVTPQLFEALAADGETKLYGALYEPVEAARRPRPVVLLVYGGPHVQSVRNSWALTADLRAQLLVQHGFAVLKVDNRGTSGRGIEFERPIYGQLGTNEVHDQCAVLEHWLARRPDFDRGRVGVCGWSYGGYLSLRCLALRPDLFAVGVAGAPVVSWADYDAPYTERYMGTPIASPHFETENAAGYRASSVLSVLSGLRGRLLLIHGMNDENVLLRHSCQLMDALMDLGVSFETVLLPNERHGVRAPLRRRHVERRILDFFCSALT
ncbi:MAG TPA: prolyl oligopeptidase family serine peptidase, partial [Polyangiaceae bacterium]